MAIRLRMRALLKCILTNALIIAILAPAIPLVARAQSQDDIDALNKKVADLYQKGKYTEAVPIAEQALETAERVLGKEHSDTLASVINLGLLYDGQGRDSEAVSLYQRALTVSEQVLGMEHPQTLDRVNNLAFLYARQDATQGRHSEAVLLFKRVLAARERVLGADHPDTLASIDNLALVYRNHGPYDEAELLYQRALEARERVLGKEHPDTLTTINNLALLYEHQGRYSEAESLHQRALEARERVLGKEHPDTLISVNNLAGVYYNQGRYSAAEPLYQRALEARERVLGKEHPDTLAAVSNLAVLYVSQGRYSEAEPLYQRALEARERVLGKEHPDTLAAVSNLAVLYVSQGGYSEAEPLNQRVLEARERVLGPEHPDTLTTVNNLALLYYNQGRHSAAEPLLKRALTAHERVLGPEHPSTFVSVNNLAGLYFSQGRYSEAEPLYQRALEAGERVLGKEHPNTLISVASLAGLYYRQGRAGAAEPLFKRALAGYQQVLGKEHPNTLAIANNLALFYSSLGRYGEAEPLYQQVLEASERVLGKEHPLTLTSVNNLAELYSDQGRYGEAESILRPAIEASERVLGKDHPMTPAGINSLARIYFAQNDWARAAELWRRSTSGIIHLMQRDVHDSGGALTGKSMSRSEQDASQFSGLVKATFRLAGGAPDKALAQDMFETAQWALGSEAAQSLAQMAARGGVKGDPKLAVTVRERQDLVAEWQARDALRNAALGQLPEQRNAKAEAENLVRLAAIDVRIVEIDKRLAAEFPDYAALASSQPLSVDDVQTQLGVDEALVLFFDTSDRKTAPEESFIWVVTKTDTRWVRSDLGTDTLTREVQALRCGLDISAWTGSHCAELVGQGYSRADQRVGKLLPFDHARAHKLYKALFGDVEDLIKGKHLLIVPAGPLTQLPFQVLVTAPTASSDHRSIRWLVRDHALTVLPAVSSLKALRRVGHSSGAAKSLIGFGNPLLDGAGDDDVAYANLAREKQSCLPTAPQHIAALRELRRGAASFKTYGRLANPAHIRMQAPLPETADELCTVARSINADVGEMRLGARATEREVKAMSESGDLAQYRIVHFATHGVMAGELDGANEPGLILTPPKEASAEDDGYLSGSEIAGLKLDADWVILSACNTAAGEAANAEALSGLARAFIYAQARALLVSHWAVDSNATVKLITAAIGEIGRDVGVGRAEALRRAMLALIDKSEPHEAHPAYWAPFIVVGEGGR